MAQHLVFQHNLTPDRVVFAYRSGDADSLEVAEYYKLKRELPASNLIALPCSSSYAITRDEYISTIEEPLLFAISALNGNLSSSGEKEIWVIVLGYHVPVVFTDEDPYDPYSETKAIASRLHRLGFSEQDQYPNYLYNRQIFKFFDYDDSAGLYITAVINGPTKAIAKDLIDRSIDVDNQTFVSGKIYVDPYGLNSTSSQRGYRDDILDFVANEAPYLGLETVSTVEPMDGSDPLVANLHHDSFYWGWHTPQYTTDLLLNQNQRRVFLYNADEEAATTFTEVPDSDGSDPWCTVAINAVPGYASCAGAIGNPGINSYLRPTPFFSALHQGASVGEAFLLSAPVVDWKIILIGDPLMCVNFPVDIPNEQDSSYTLVTNDEGIRLAKEAIEESLAYALRQSRLAEELLETVYMSQNLEEQVALLYPVNQWKNLRNESDQYNLLTPSVMNLVRYISSTTGADFFTWLINNSEKTTEYMQNLISAGIPTVQISDDLVRDEGSWHYDFDYVHPRQRLENVHFRIQIATDDDFSDIEVDESSFDEESGWKYEQSLNRFVQIASSGVSSSFSGRRIRYESPLTNYLIRTELYYVRWRLLNSEGSSISDWVADENQIIIKN